MKMRFLYIKYSCETVSAQVSACADGLYNSDYEHSCQCGGGDDHDHDNGVLEFIHLFLGWKILVAQFDATYTTKSTVQHY